LFQITVLFKSVIRKLKQEWDRRLDSDLSITQVRLLFILHNDGPQKTLELANRLVVTPGAVTGMADKLLSMGLLERNRGENDRRVVILQITDEGRSKIASMKEMQMDIISSYFGDLPDEDIAHLQRIFTQILKNLTDKE